jgi:MFS family permease
MIAHFEQKYYRFHQLSASFKFLLLSSFFVALGSFMVNPFIGVYLKDHLKMDVKLVGVLMAMSTFIQFAGSFISGLFVQSVGLKKSMTIGLTFRVLGFLMLALSSWYLQASLAALIFGAMGMAIYMTANKAYVVSSSTSIEKPLSLSLSNATFNMGMALGPIVAASFFALNPPLLFSGIALLFIGLIAIHFFKLKEIKTGDVITVNMTEMRASFVKIKRPILINTMTFYLFFHFQHFMGMYAAEVSGLALYGKIVLINLLLVFFIQIKFSQWISKAHLSSLYFLSYLSVGVGMAVMGLGHAEFLIFGMILMTVGQAMLFLRGELEVVNLLPDKPAIAFGFQRLSAGLGGLLSGIFGSYIYDYCQQHTLGHFWPLIAIQTLPIIFFCIFQRGNLSNLKLK